MIEFIKLFYQPVDTFEAGFIDLLFRLLLILVFLSGLFFVEFFKWIGISATFLFSVYSVKHLISRVKKYTNTQKHKHTKVSNFSYH